MSVTRKVPLTTVFVTRSGISAGVSDCAAAFATKDEAVRFLGDLHGLSADELRTLRRTLSLQLDRKLHGSEWCTLVTEKMSDDQARMALSGELFIESKKSA